MRQLVVGLLVSPGGGVVFAVLNSLHTAWRAGPGMLLLFAHVEHAALNPAVVLFLPVLDIGALEADYSLHTNAHTEGL